VYYGDEEKIPRTPAITVAGIAKTRELAGTGHQTLNSFEVVMTIFHAKYGSVQVNRQECDKFAEEVEEFLHSDRRLGGELIHSFVSRVEPGYVARGEQILAGTRITWQGLSKTRLGEL